MDAQNAIAKKPPRRPASRPDSCGTRGTRVPPSLAAFIASNPPQRSARPSRSPLDKYRTEITELAARGYSLDEIQGYLKNVGHSASRTAIHNFIKKAAAAAAPSSKQPTSQKESTK